MKDEIKKNISSMLGLDCYFTLFFLLLGSLFYNDFNDMIIPPFISFLITGIAGIGLFIFSYTKEPKIYKHIIAIKKYRNLEETVVDAIRFYSATVLYFFINNYNIYSALKGGLIMLIAFYCLRIPYILLFNSMVPKYINKTAKFSQYPFNGL